MQLWVLLTYAYLVGSAFAGCAGSVLEIRFQEPAGLRRPYVSPDRLARSLSLTLAAGPYLLLAELKLARESGKISRVNALCGLAFASGWTLASGIILVELMALLAKLFH